jgi:hypothetical protein
MAWPVEQAHSANSTQFCNPTYFHPLDYEDVATVIKICAVRRNELARVL